MKKRNHLIMGSAFTLATLAIAIDHTRHPLPEPSKAQQGTTEKGSEAPSDANPCSMNPCSMNPCGLNSGSDGD